MKIKDLIEELKKIEEKCPEMNVGIKYVTSRDKIYTEMDAIGVTVADEDVDGTTWITNE